MQDLSNLIGGHPFLAGMEAAQTQLLVPGARLIRFAPGGVIAREGDEANRFYLIVRGEVAIEAVIPGKGTTQFQTAGTGDALGWSWMFPPHRWHFTARAAQEIEALEWSTDDLRKLAEKHPQFGYELARRLTQLLLQRLRATHSQLMEFYGAQG